MEICDNNTGMNGCTVGLKKKSHRFLLHDVWFINFTDIVNCQSVGVDDAQARLDGPFQNEEDGTHKSEGIS